MEKIEQVVTTSPNQENIRIKTCQTCGRECKQVYTPAVLEYNEFLKREMIVESEKWEWVDPNDCLSGDFPSLCVKCKAEAVEKHRRELEAWRAADKKRKIVEAIGGERNYENFTFNKYIPTTDSQRAALEACKNFEPLFENLLLVGPAGVGKSHLASATLADNFESNGARYRVTELLRLLRYKRSAEEEDVLIKKFVDMPILVIEDFGVQKQTDWSTAMLWEILDRRIETGKNGLIITSNVGRGKLAEEMGDKITSRLSQICRVIKLDGADMRQVEVLKTGER